MKCGLNVVNIYSGLETWFSQPSELRALRKHLKSWGLAPKKKGGAVIMCTLFTGHTDGALRFVVYGPSFWAVHAHG